MTSATLRGLMVVLAVSAAWVGVVGTALGGILGFLSSWLVHRSEREERLEERARAERKEAYAALLASAEESMHRFDWLANGVYSSAGQEEDRKAADRFYDQEVAVNLNLLRIIGASDVKTAGTELRRSLGAVRRLMKREPPPSASSSEYTNAHERYRAARRRFIVIARVDLERKRAAKEPTGSFLARLRQS